MKVFVKRSVIFVCACSMWLVTACTDTSSPDEPSPVLSVSQDTIVGDSLTMKLRDVTYEEGYLCGTIDFYDDAITAYYEEHAVMQDDYPDIQDCTEYLNDQYKLMIAYGDEEYSLSISEYGGTYGESGTKSCYTETFKHYIGKDDMTINIYLENGEDIFVMELNK